MTEVVGTPYSNTQPGVLGNPESQGSPSVVGTPYSNAQPVAFGNPPSENGLSVVSTPYSNTQPGVLGDPESQASPSVVGTPIVQPSPDSGSCGQVTCRPDCEWIFDRVVVFPVTNGGTTVEWILHPQFRDSAPYSFQLQVGKTGNSEADDWTDVGDPVIDGFSATDDEQRVWGAAQWTHYRVKLDTFAETYYSKPQSALGALSRQDWVKWKNHLRMWSLQLRKSPGSSKGFLLKRRLYGEPCDCLDPQTGEIRKPQHEPCYGTGWIGGYFTPMGCTFADMGLQSDTDKTDIQMRGMATDNSFQAKMLAYPQLHEKDVFVEQGTDVRYAIRGLQYIAAQTGMPVLVSAKLVPLPFDNVIYKFPILDLNG